MDGAVSVSRLAWDVARQRHGIEQHHMLHIKTPQVSVEDYPDLERRALDELARLGLAAGRDVSSELLDVMALLAAPPLELQAWIGRSADVVHGAVAATDGRAALLAVLDDKSIQLRGVRPDALPQAIVGLLPRMPAGRGRSVTVPVDAYRDVVEDDGRGSARAAGSVLQSNRAPDQVTADCRAMQRILSQTRRGGGQVYAAARSAFGQRRKTQHPIAYVDLESGRWLTKQRPDSTGAIWAVLAPASSELLTTELNDLLHTLDQ